MPQTDIAGAVASDLTNTMTDFSVAPQTTDAAADQKENHWMSSDEDVSFEDALGYYKDKKTPEITAVIDAKSSWTVGKGIQADEPTIMLLDTIKGCGFDTFNSLMENAIRTMLLGGNFYAEKIYDDEDNLINLKPLDPSVMRHVTNPKGMIIRFDKMSKNFPSKVEQKLPPEKIFCLLRNRIADETHGTGIAQKLKLIIDMKNEAMEDYKIVMHRNVYPRMVFHLDTDDETEVAAFKTKMDNAYKNHENFYVPKDVVVPEVLAVAPNATLNPMAWIQYLDNLFYELAGIPKIIVGGSGEFTEASAKIAYLAFQQSVEEEQLFIEEQVLSQLGIVINLEFPASLENELLSDNKKDGAQNIDPSETTAGQGQ